TIGRAAEGERPTRQLRRRIFRSVSTTRNAIMIQETPQADLFKKQLGESLLRETRNSRAVKFARHENVYTVGERDEMVYYIHSAGDIFGELCLSGVSGRVETAVAMKVTIVKRIPASQFFARLQRDALVEGFVRYLAVRVADQQQVIA